MYQTMSAAEFEESRTLAGTVETVRNACMEAARDLGLSPGKGSTASLFFSDSRRYSPLRARISVTISGDNEQVHISYLGTTAVTYLAWGADYLRRVISEFAMRVEREVAAPLVTPESQRIRTRRRALLKWLTIIQWLPAAVLVPPAIILAGLYWDDPRLYVGLLVCFWLVAPVAQGVEVVRKRLVNIDLFEDYVVLSIAAFLALLGTLPVALGLLV